LGCQTLQNGHCYLSRVKTLIDTDVLPHPLMLQYTVFYRRHCAVAFEDGLYCLGKDIVHGL